MREFLEKKTVGWYIFGGAAILALIALIAYVARGGDIFTQLNGWAIACVVIGVVLTGVLMWKDIKPLEVVPFILYFIFLLIFAGSEIDFLGNVVYGTDGSIIDVAFYITAIFGLLSVIAGMTASIMKIEKEAE